MKDNTHQALYGAVEHFRLCLENRLALIKQVEKELDNTTQNPFDLPNVDMEAIKQADKLVEQSLRMVCEIAQWNPMPSVIHLSEKDLFMLQELSMQHDWPHSKIILANKED